MSVQKEKSGLRSAAGRPLLSRSSILILSGILVGMGLRDGLENELYLLGYFTGVVGIISYFGLEMLAQHRHREATKVTLQKAATVLNSWLDKEVGEGPRDATSTDKSPARPSGVSG
jgi:hypothetical protein